MKHLKKELAVLNEVCEVRAFYSTKVKATDRKQILSASDSISVLYPFYEAMGMLEQKEIFSCVFLTRANKLLSVAKISEGSATACVVDVQYIYRLALLQNAQAIILCHNHPSGNIKPSDADIKLTKQMKESASLLNIQLIDHVILSGDGKDAGFYSFANEGDL
jgi:DNA repair protein RadC